MTRKVVSLSVHKNHKARRHAKAMASDIPPRAHESTHPERR